MPTPRWPSVLVLRLGEGAGPLRWRMSVDDVVAVLGEPAERLRGPGAPDRLVWTIASQGEIRGAAVAGAVGSAAVGSAAVGGAAAGGEGGRAAVAGDDGGAAVAGGTDMPDDVRQLVVEVEESGNGLLSVGVDGHVVQVDGQVHDLRDPQALELLDPVLHEGAHVFLDWGLERWGVERWGIEPAESSFLRVLAPGPAAQLRELTAAAPRYTELRVTARELPTTAGPWTVRPGDGIGPLSFGLTRAEVRDLLGPAEKDVLVQGLPREVRGDLVCVFGPDDRLVEIRWGQPHALHLDGVPLGDRAARPEVLTRSTPLLNRAWDVHVDLGLAVQRDAGPRGEVVAFAGSRAALWTNLHRPLL